MFTFEKRDEGFTCTRDDDGRTIALIDICTIHTIENVDGDPKKPKLAKPQDIVTPLKKDDFRIHFTGTRLTVVELEALLAELPSA